MKYKELYAGFTKDLKKRYKQHLNGEVKSTKNRQMKLIHYEAYLSEKDARRREKYFKTTKGKRTLQLILKESLKEVVHVGPVVPVYQSPTKSDTV